MAAEEKDLLKRIVEGGDFEFADAIRELARRVLGGSANTVALAEGEEKPAESAPKGKKAVS